MMHFDGNIAIETKKLAKTYYGDFWKKPVDALLPMDLQVGEGESFGFIGPNGAGKTTTIKILLLRQLKIWNSSFQKKTNKMPIYDEN